MRIYFILIGTMMIWGVNVSLIKILVDHFPPVTITALRIFTASLAVFFTLKMTNNVRRPQGKEWGYIFGGALLSVVCHHYFLAEGLTKTSATNAGLILGLGPLLTALFATMLLKGRLTVARWIGFLLGGVGVSFTVLAGETGISTMTTGDIDIFLAILSQALSFILIKKAAATLDPRLLTGYMLFFGSLVLFVISLWMEPQGLAHLSEAPPFVWIVFFFSAIMATAFGHMIYNYAIGKIGAAEASIFMNLSTFFSLVGAAVLLDESMLPAHFIGFMLIVSGVLLGSGSLEELWLQRKRNIQIQKRS
ncbi:DMT family transporter [Bacillus sp. FJAT-52991]|uniref:DMT family transporter n=1 Tax=Bacillus kandeliae TaxID=3129297 RepID=A0ABZ2NC61_9BACI